MPIQVHCSACQRKLRVPETLVGKQVKCPACGERITIRAEGDEPAPPPPERPKPPPPLPDDAIQPSKPKAAPSRAKSDDEYDFDDEPPTKKRSKARWEDDDEDDDRDEDDDDFGRRRSLGRSIKKRRPDVTWYLLPPAICLMITGFLGAGINLFQFIIALVDPQVLQNNNIFGGADAPPWLSALFGLIFTLLALGTIAGSASMMAKKYYFLSMAGTILAMINIGNCCCAIGLPFGIWGLIMLCLPDVKDAYG